MFDFRPYLNFELNDTEDGYILTGFKDTVPEIQPLINEFLDPTDNTIKIPFIIPNDYNELPIIEIGSDVLMPLEYIIADIFIISNIIFEQTDNLIKINARAFRPDSHLTKVYIENLELPESLQYIGYFAFEDCQINNMYIGDNIEYIGDTFLNLNKLSLPLKDNLISYATIDVDTLNVRYLYVDTITDNNLGNINAYNINLDERIKHIARYSMIYAYNINLDYIETIGDMGLQVIRNSGIINLPNIKSLGTGAIVGPNIDKAIIGNKIESIEDCGILLATPESAMSKISEVEIWKPTPPMIRTGMMEYTLYNFHLPVGSEDAYLSDPDWEYLNTLGYLTFDLVEYIPNIQEVIDEGIQGENYKTLGIYLGEPHLDKHIIKDYTGSLTIVSNDDLRDLSKNTQVKIQGEYEIVNDTPQFKNSNILETTLNIPATVTSLNKVDFNQFNFNDLLLMPVNVKGEIVNKIEDPNGDVITIKFKDFFGQEIEVDLDYDFNILEIEDQINQIEDFEIGNEIIIDDVIVYKEDEKITLRVVKFSEFSIVTFKQLGDIYYDIDFKGEFKGIKLVTQSTMNQLKNDDIEPEEGTLYISNESRYVTRDGDKSKVDIITTDGDGTKYLSDDGSYKEISIQSRIQNTGNTQFVDTQASEVAIDLSPSLSGGGGSETGRFKLARNFFELYAEKIHTNPNLKYKYHLTTKDNGSIEIVVEDSDEISGKGKETYSFDFMENENPNQVTRMKELQDAVDTIADMLGVL